MGRAWIVLSVFLVSFLAMTGLVATPSAAQDEVPQGFVTIPGNEAGWFIYDDGTKQWLSPACRIELEAAGTSAVVTEWAVLAGLAKVPPEQARGCDELRGEASSAHRLVQTAQQSGGAAWVVTDSTRQWIPASCVTELAVTPVETTWRELQPLEAVQGGPSCSELARLLSGVAGPLASYATFAAPGAQPVADRQQ